MLNVKAVFYQLNRINPNRTQSNYKLFKIVLVLLIVTGLIFTASQNLAQETDDPIQEVQRGQEAEITQEGWLTNALKTTTVNFVQVFVGKVPSSEELTSMRQNGQPYLPGGLLGTTTSYIAQAYTPPASGVEYLAHIKNNLLGTPVYAQGVGFQGLTPILSVWRSFRNIVYVLSSVFFIILGIMIMFRLKINPQTILTIQNAVPKIITTLLLVTFSYAIAGLLIDLIYLIQNIALAALFAGQGKSFTDNLIRGGLNDQLFHSTNFAKLSGGDLGDMLKLANLALPKNMIFIFGTVICAVVGTFISPGTGSLIGFGIGGIVFLLLVLILITIWILQFFFGIIKAYVNIIFKIILAPLEIGLGAIPGMKIGFSSWITGLFANLMIFPISLLFMVLANIIIEATSGTSHNLWAPSMVKYNTPGTLTNVLAGVSGGLVPVSIGISSLMILGKLPTLIPQVIFAIKPSGWESAIGQSAQLENLPFIGKPLSVVKQGIDKSQAESAGRAWDRHGLPLAQRRIKNWWQTSTVRSQIRHKTNKPAPHKKGPNKPNRQNTPPPNTP